MASGAGWPNENAAGCGPAALLRRERDEAIAAAAAAGRSTAAIGRAFGLAAMSVSRVLSRDAGRGGSRVPARAGPGGTS